MKNTIMGIKVSNKTIRKIKEALKYTKIDRNSWLAGYSTAKAENEIIMEYKNGKITEEEWNILDKFLRNITLKYKEERRESLYTNEWRKKTHICNVPKEAF